MILLIDNYDSFSYNLYQLVGSINPDIKVIRNDDLTVAEIEKLNPEKIIISPGPGRPENAGVCIDVIKYFNGKAPILGVCLGHQAICKAFGAEVSYAKTLMHGKQSEAFLQGNSKIFAGLGDSITVARYHSLAAKEETMPAELEITAKTQDGEIMAVQYKGTKTYGVQFHPESILTPCGKQILKNFLED